MERDFKTILKRLRLKHGMSQEDLATALGFDNKVRISSYETGKAEPSLKTIFDLAKIFNVSTDYLLGLNEDEGLIAHIEEQTKLFEQYKKDLDSGKEVLLEEMKNKVLNTSFQDEKGKEFKLSEKDQQEIIKALSFGFSMIQKQAGKK